MKLPTLTTISTLLSLAFNAHTANGYSVGEIVVYKGYQCDNGGTILQFDSSTNGDIMTIGGSGGAKIDWIDPGCSVWLCFAGYGCNDGSSGMQRLDPNTCL